MTPDTTINGTLLDLPRGNYKTTDRKVNSTVISPITILIVKASSQDLGCNVIIMFSSFKFGSHGIVESNDIL